MKKIGFINAKAGTLAIYYDEKARVNPYRVYREWKDLHPTEGYVQKHKMLIQKYANLFSCTILINDWVRQHDEEDRKF